MLKQGMTETVIDGTVGVLELRYTIPKSFDPNLSSLKLVVLSHPHPLHGGTMNNKVVTTMERAFKSLGYVTVAYNFRGVLGSAGEYDHGVGEQEDLYAVVAWAKQKFEVTRVTLAGFSFGSYVLLSAHPKIQKIVDVEALCTVAPPVGLYDFSEIRGGGFSWALIQGGQDEVVSAKDILNWAVGMECAPDLYWRAQAGHFFHGELIWLKKMVLSLYG